MTQNITFLQLPWRVARGNNSPILPNKSNEKKQNPLNFAVTWNVCSSGVRDGIIILVISGMVKPSRTASCGSRLYMTHLLSRLISRSSGGSFASYKVMLPPVAPTPSAPDAIQHYTNTSLRKNRNQTSDFDLRGCCPKSFEFASVRVSWMSFNSRLETVKKLLPVYIKD